MISCLKRVVFSCVPACVAALAVACSGSVASTYTPYPTYTPQPTYTPVPTYTPYPAPVVTLRIVDDFFQEADIVVVRGTTVTWANEGEAPHTSSSARDSREQWDTGYLMPGQKASHTFNQPGMFFYYCRVHEYMTATIRVLE